jgi:hypothetical protein
MGSTRSYNHWPEELRGAAERHDRLHDLVHDAINSTFAIDLNLKWLRDSYAYNDVGKTKVLNVKFEELEELEQVYKLLEQAEAHMETFMSALRQPKEEEDV